MPRINDLSYHAVFIKPEFYDDEQREEYIQKRIFDTITENKVPPVPTRQQELDYLEKLELDFRNDRWLHARFRKLQAGPLRIPYKKSRELLQENRMVGWINFMIGAILISPLAVFVGRHMRTSSGGVPLMHLPRAYHNFPNVNPDRYARIRFRIGFLATLVLGGFGLATFTTPNVFKDEYYSRPDLKPDTPMVEDTEDIKRAKDEFYKGLYVTEGCAEKIRLFKNSPVYRLFRPNHALYEIRYPDRKGTDNNYNHFKRDRMIYPSDSRMHEQHWH
mmetsp:Transcript_13141/g.15202  ORF Transcript_13141/g.15202 Transcript_13141/m.15202 type:complete len:275 (-) Transcript_13141:28-852(-)